MNLRRLHNDIHEGALQLIAEHREQLFAKAKSICRNDDEADELVIRTIDRAIRKVNTYTGEGDVLSWMMTIMVNIHNHDCRNPVVRGTLAVSADEIEKYAGADWSTDEEILRNSDGEAVRAALRNLDPEDREILILRYYEELSLKEIASFLNKPVGTIGRRIHVALKLLAGKLGAKMNKTRKPLAVALAALVTLASVAAVATLPAFEPLCATVAGWFGASVETPVETPSRAVAAAEPALREELKTNEQFEVVKEETQEMNKITNVIAAAVAATVLPTNVVAAEAPAQQSAVNAPLATGENAPASDLSPKLYVQNGLVAFWDAICNATNENGELVHDNVTRTWCDLVAGRPYTLNAPVVWKDNQIVFSGAASCWATLSAADSVTAYAPASDGTLDVCVSGYPQLISSQGPALIQYTAYPNCVFPVQAVDSATKPAFFVFNGASTTASVVTNTYCIQYQGNVATSAFVCGEAARFSPAGVRKTNESGSQIGALAFNNRGTGSFFAIRTYSRPLSKDEMAWNVALDRARYFGDPLPSGYRIEGGKAQVKLDVAANEEFSIDGGASWQTAAAVWMDLGSTVVLKVRKSGGRKTIVWDGLHDEDVVSTDADELAEATLHLHSPRVVAAETIAPDRVWTASGGNWSVPGNWSPAGVPQEGEFVYVPSSADVGTSVSITANVANVVLGRLVVGSGNPKGRVVLFAHQALALTQSAAFNTGSTVTRANSGTIKISVTNDLTVGAGVIFDVQGRGTGTDDVWGYSSRHGGESCDMSTPARLRLCYGSIPCPTATGKGSNAGNGGGVILLTAGGTMRIDGRLNADGKENTNGSSYSPAGGSIWVTAGKLIGGGSLTTSGGIKSTGGFSGRGPGGRLAVHLTGDGSTFADFAGTFECDGAGPGTMYFRQPGQAMDEGELVIEQKTFTGGYTDITKDVTGTRVGKITVKGKPRIDVIGENVTLTCRGDWYSEGRMTLRNGGAFIFDPVSTATIGGSCVFPSFICNAPGKTLKFGTAETDVFAIGDNGTLTLTGAEGNPMTLVGEPESAVWKVNVGANVVQSNAYLVVTNSDASGGATVEASKSSGCNCTNWKFPRDIVPGETNVWTGALNADFVSAANWSLERAPVSTDALLIRGNAVNMPVCAVPTAAFASLELEPGANLGISSESFAVRDFLTIPSGSALALTAGDLLVGGRAQIAGSLSCAAGKSVAFSNDVSFANGQFSANGGRFVLVGPGDRQIDPPAAFFALRIEKSGGTVSFAKGFAADSITYVSTESGGVIFASGESVTVRTVVFDGRQGQISLAGTSGERWILDATSDALSFLNVAVSGAASSGRTIYADAGSVNGGNNDAHWIFNANSIWVGNGDGVRFSDPQNWFGQSVPGADARVALADAGLEVLIDEPVTIGDLVIGGGDGVTTLRCDTNMTVTGSVDVRANGVLTANKPISVGGDVTLRTGAKMTHTALPGSADTEAQACYKIDVSVRGDMTLEQGAVIEASGLGYSANHGPGRVADLRFQFNYRGAASHGGFGSGALPCYGSVFCPTTCGSGSSSSSGGGAIKLAVRGTLTLGGDVLAQPGVNSFGCESGAAGSIWIDCRKLAGGGAISARGVHSSTYAGGGGGRIAVYIHGEDAYTGLMEAGGSESGDHDKSGGAGTIYRQLPGEEDSAGTIVVDNTYGSGPAGNLLRCKETQLPMAADGKPSKAYQKATLVVQKRAKVRLMQSMRVKDLDMRDDSILDLGTNTLTILAKKHRDREGWSSLAKVVCTTNEATGAYGKLVWRPSGFLISIH